MPVESKVTVPPRFPTSLSRCMPGWRLPENNVSRRTGCVITGSGATCLAHCDGSNTRSEVSLIIKAVRALTANLKEGRFELHLIGGFLDDLSTSCDLSRQLLGNCLLAFNRFQF
ncbi:NTAN1 amidohydrolase, partial [Polypterus senegalus]